MASQPKSHQTTIRFSEELWRRLEQAADELEVSVAQYLRDTARARLDGEPWPRRDQLPQALGREMDIVRSAAKERIEDSSALWEQGRQARMRAAQLREQAARQRTRNPATTRAGGGVSAPERKD